MILQDVSRLLAKKRSFMFSFMERYLFSQIEVRRTEVISNFKNFDGMINFCLRTREPFGMRELPQGKAYFSNNFQKIQDCVHEGCMQDLQKIGSVPEG